MPSLLVLTATIVLTTLAVSLFLGVFIEAVLDRIGPRKMMTDAPSRPSRIRT